MTQTSGPVSFGSQFLKVSEADISRLTLRGSKGSTVRGHITLEGAPARVRPQDFRFNFVLTDPDQKAPFQIFFVRASCLRVFVVAFVRGLITSEVSKFQIS
ncbi:MAG: hypothetical protein DMF97_19050 [Acidobacteria bacterium]|nr:MAG: hypothetical protein DMF97_19050 [Acidobacteriota bacterium]